MADKSDGRRRRATPEFTMSGSDSSPASTAAVARGLDPAIGLATSVHAEPGVYALLLGSGVSSAAGIPTGWQIVTDLVRRVATAKDADVPPADFDPVAWWAEHGDGEPLGYSSLLHTLASTAAARDGLLRGYFDASADDREQGLKVPTAAHHAIAELVARGSIRVILTTNFDRLLEQALEQRGIQPQVIHRAEQIPAMTPLVHAPVTIIKLHGDFHDLDKRNTIDELASYPEDLAGLLLLVLDDYGLVISGWSGEWDLALVGALEQLRQRRYPLYWTCRSNLREEAAKLAVQLGAVVVSGVSADQVFTGLTDRLAALDKLKAPPLTRDLAVAQLKKCLADPVKRIELHDLVLDEVRRIEIALADPVRFPSYLPNLTDAEFSARYDQMLVEQRAEIDTLLHLVAAGAYHGGPEHHALWTKVVQRLLSLRRQTDGTFQEVLVASQLHPALLVVTVMLAAGRLSGRDTELVRPLLLAPALRLTTDDREKTAANHLHAYRVFPRDIVNALPRWAAAGQNNRWLWPVSELFRAELAEPLKVFEPAPTRVFDAIDRAELLISVAQLAAQDVASLGRFVIGQQWMQGPLPALVEVRSELTSTTSALSLLVPDADAATQLCDKLEAEVARAGNRF